ncbi:MAG: hypothetical protein ACYC99_17355 [Candidatus Geothermincolia bacterium]
MNHKQYRNRMKARRACEDDLRRRREDAHLDGLKKKAQAWLDEILRDQYDIWGGRR